MKQFEFLSLSFVFLVCCFRIFSIVSPTSLRQYGESCESTATADLSCNSKETLSCINETCQCADPSSMIFDSSRELCVGLAGKPCVYHQSEEEFVVYRRNQCSMYSQCENKTCTCWSGFYPDDNGHCLRKKDYVEACNSSDECDHRKGFTCINGLCSCSNKTGVYIPSKGRCVGLPGEKCLNRYKECVSRFKCLAEKCVCKYRESEAPDGSMICEPMWHKFGKKCGKYKNSCGDEKDMGNLWCIDSKCRCRNPDYQVYDHDARACLSLVGGPCSLPNLKLHLNRTNSRFDPVGYIRGGRCIQYAQCVPYRNAGRKENEIPLGNSSNITSNAKNTKNKTKNAASFVEGSTGRCECLENFSETASGRCSLPFGASCDTRTNKFDKCDKTIPLSCVNFKCSCKNELDVYESKVRKCKKTVGSLCQKANECIRNAECVVRAAGIPGRCSCRTRFQTAVNGTCM